MNAVSLLETLDLLVGLGLKLALLLAIDHLLGLIRVTRVYREAKTAALRSAECKEEK